VQGEFLPAVVFQRGDFRGERNWSVLNRWMSHREPAGKARGPRAVLQFASDYKGSRMSVMIDDCEKPDYRPSP
jgi:hypothetical protein